MKTKYMIRSKLAHSGAFLVALRLGMSGTRWLAYSNTEDDALSWDTLIEALAVYNFIRTEGSVTAIEVIEVTPVTASQITVVEG